MPELSSQKLMLLIAVAIIILGYVILKLKAHFAKGELVQALLVDNRVVMLTGLHQASGGGMSSTAGGSRYIRLKIVDAATGKVTGRKIISPQYEIRMVVNGIIWLALNRARYQKRADQELIAIDVFSLKKVFDANQLKKALGIGRNELFHSLNFDTKTSQLLIVTAAGFNHTFDCTTLQASGASKNSLPSPDTYTAVQSQRAGKFHFDKLENTERFRLFHDKIPFNGNESFVNPVCLFAGSTANTNEVLVFFHQRDLNRQTESYLSIARQGDSKITHLLTINAASTNAVEVFRAGETNTHTFISTRHATRDSVIAIDKSTASLSWRCKN